MNTERTASGLEKTVDQEALVDRVKREILTLIEAGRIPAYVRSFPALHDHVDANELGGFCDDDLNDWMSDQLRKPDDDPECMPKALIDLIERVQNAVHAWIESGDMARARAEVLLARFRERHPEAKFETLTPEEVGFEYRQTPLVVIAISTNDMCIVNALSSECGRFPIEPAYYGVNKTTADEIRAFNNIEF